MVRSGVAAGIRWSWSPRRGSEAGPAQGGSHLLGLAADGHWLLEVRRGWRRWFRGGPRDPIKAKRLGAHIVIDPNGATETRQILKPAVAGVHSAIHALGCRLTYSRG